LPANGIWPAEIFSLSTESKRPLGGLLVTQFFGAFNDNAWKQLVLLLGMNSAYIANQSNETANLNWVTWSFLALTSALFVFTLPAAYIADRFSKRSLIISMKLFELALMGTGLFFLWKNPDGSMQVFIILLIGLGAQSAFFSPAKYGIVPQLVPHKGLSHANGLLELFTILAIVGGTLVMGSIVPYLGVAKGNWLVDGENLVWMAGGLLFLFSVVGLFTSFAIPKVPPAGTPGSLVDILRNAWRDARSKRPLWLAILGLAFYWGIASFLGPVAIVKGEELVRDFDGLLRNNGLLMGCFAFGVALGSYITGRLSSGKVEYGFIPLGGIGMAFFTLVLGIGSPGFSFSTICFFFVGVCSGFIMIPLHALLQWQSSSEHRGSVIALSNIFTFGGMIIGNLLGILLGNFGVLAHAWGIVDDPEKLKIGVDGLFIGAGLLTTAATIWSLFVVPEALIRLLLVFFTNTFYRLRVVGAENVPSEGGALLVPNHVSFVDGIFLVASIDRPIRFIADSSYFEHPIYGRFLRAIDAIEISSAGGPRVILRAMRDAGQHIDDGHLVCIFGEGQITRTGQLQPFRRGLERIVKGREAPVIPVNLDGVWGSIFSRSGGRFITKLPKKIPYPVTISFGEPMGPGVPVTAVRKAVQNLGSEAWNTHRQSVRPLHYGFIRSCRPLLKIFSWLGLSLGILLALYNWGEPGGNPLWFALAPIGGLVSGVLLAHLFGHPFRLTYADLQRPRVGRLGALIGAIALSLRLRREWKDQEHVGIMLPPSVGSTLINIGAAMSAKTSVNLNYTAGKDGLESAIRQAGLKTVVTSRIFLKKAEVELPGNIEPIWAEDLKKTIGLGCKLKAMLLALLAPAALIEKICSGGKKVFVDDIVTIIFSSGSTGEPKGVLLSHFNVASNLEGVSQIVRPREDDRLLGILPHFHSFGYMTLWFASNESIGSVFLANPVDAEMIGQKVQQYKVTMLLSTPTFLQIYLRRCTAAQFGSLRLVITGAEKLTDRVAKAFEDQFGIRPLEGYGTTECAPVVAVNTLDFRSAGFYQPGSRKGTVGQPLPGVSVKVVDPDDFDTEMEIGDPGMLLVSGPNIMQGYLGKEDLTDEVLLDGWYVTGDIAAVDEEGFIRITDRLARFSKIGGEMVPHGKVEDSLQEASGEVMQVFAVTCIPDEKKGERLAVLHTLSEDVIPGIVDQLSDMGLPNLFIPRANQFVQVKELPLLGTGKLDLRGIKKIAMEAFGVEPEQEGK
jgi:acyl-[acyl-carrier-protein]-phospholipid O-acyltransferase/long-chain-fatty-acid--[acyl-carrier-protein] ligase